MSKGALDVRHTINAWESILFHSRFLMSPSTIVIVESTIHYLKELEAMRINSEKGIENSLQDV